MNNRSSRRTHLHAYATAALVLSAAACKARDPADTAQTAPHATEATPLGAASSPNAAGSSAHTETQASASAKNIYADRCTDCHGAAGRGDGAKAAQLKVKPRDYTDKSWQASVTDEQLAAVIVRGGEALGRSAEMPAQPDLADKPEVVRGLVGIIRGFAP